MAHVNVRCWQETYRGVMSDAALDDPGLLAARERFWTAALTDERFRENRVAVAERDGGLVGIAMSGPPLDPGSPWTRQLYVLYVYAADHGTGAGPSLLEAVVDPEESVALWVADPNPRAQEFYRKHSFVADGTAQIEGGVREIRMVRGPGTVGNPVRRRRPTCVVGWLASAEIQAALSRRRPHHGADERARIGAIFRRPVRWHARTVDLAIRPVQPGDFDGVLRLAPRLLIGVDPSRPADQVWDAVTGWVSDSLAAAAAADPGGWVAVLDETIVGYVSVADDETTGAGEDAWVGELVVDERYEGRGIARSLIAKVEDWAKRPRVDSRTAEHRGSQSWGTSLLRADRLRSQ